MLYFEFPELIHLITESLYPLINISTLPYPLPEASNNHHLLSVTIIWLFLDATYSEIPQYLSFYVWLALNIMSSRFTRVAANSRISFLSWILFTHTQHLFFIQSSVNRRVVFTSGLLWLMLQGTRECRYLFQIVIIFLTDIYPKWYCWITWELCFWFFEEPPSYFHRVCTNLLSHQQCTRAGSLFSTFWEGDEQPHKDGAARQIHCGLHVLQGSTPHSCPLYSTQLQGCEAASSMVGIQPQRVSMTTAKKVLSQL